MNKNLLLIIALFLIIICIVSIMVINKRSEMQELTKENKIYENYLNKETIGTDIASLISMVVNENEKNNIPKDEHGYYIENEENSIKIDLKMTTIDKTFPMEDIYNNKIVNFVQHFRSIKFKCIDLQYHKKTGKVAKLVFEELQ